MQARRESLAALAWTLTGCNPYEWKLRRSLETGAALSGEIPPMPAPVPGSVQQACLEAGWIPDWNRELNARCAEWIENRHWVYRTMIPESMTAGPGRKVLVCEGLDYAGRILINREEVHAFANSFVPHRVDITDAVRPGENELMLVFECPPRWLGQFGYTSRMRQWKPRFNYHWDWTSRLVQIGVWDDIYLESFTESLQGFCARTVCDDARLGLHLRADAVYGPGRVVAVRLFEPGGDEPLFTGGFPAHLLGGDGRFVDLTICRDRIRRWFPNGLGEQRLYRLEVSLRAEADAGPVLDTAIRRVGFKHVAWKQNPGSRADADPWWAHVNGRGFFLQGANWTPIRPNFADVTEAQYRSLLTTYRDLGFNLLRVWGGAFLEKEVFYDLCDELGLLVWQEFPLSSSGVDNCPPDDPTSVQELGEIARSYVTRRMHHACHFVWCGGNELRQETTGNTPITLNHPVMRQFKMVVDQLDSGKRFVPSTPSGPCFSADASNYGKGIHWAVNGPWKANGSLEESWRRYWAEDDALLRSETGLPGPSSAALIRKYNDPEKVFPCSDANPIWRRQPWWIEWDQFRDEHGRDAESLDEYVAWGQERQRRGLEHALRCSKNRYPRCGGVIFWMGHDSFPCTANTSLIDFDGALKPAAATIGELFNAPVEQPDG